ncbi:tripartite tricarboxylate transporter TctB family protein [Pseudarthrobacter raffinosi]|uniref:tripartite tricarboxylate transporter TctB family protein n=1 Tax=Pseudarthrobacter raffinosi TaxID=2953651 RepID=UPI00208F5627|nr:tripartite tricarboxylate transporter TctB family protein [Pseudarthrobacter sp. MDT3-9]MCO4252081.1 tripartite tricarboxylate transporter TctB family protein [Pseudarthrobacter sp. MDT3-9]
MDESQSSAPARRKGTFIAKHAVTLGIMAVAGAVLVISLGYNLGSLVQPGSGLWPATLAVVVMILCVVLILVPGLDAEMESHEAVTTWQQWRTLAFAVIPLLLFAPLMVMAGTSVAAALLAFYWLKVLHRCSIRYSLIWAAIFTVAVNLIFILGLGIDLPAGLVFGGVA